MGGLLAVIVGVVALWIGWFLVTMRRLASDPTTVYHALSCYHAQPDLRAELATPDALDRISNGRAVGLEQP